MERIDRALERARIVLSEISDYSETIRTEADTRLKAVDRFLVELLGWQFSEISTEERAGTGFLDYKLSIDGRARLVIEAKRDATSFGLKEANSGRAYKIDGPVLNAKHVNDGIVQAVEYGAWKGNELACVTNGREWIIFRSNRRDGKDVREGSAFVFATGTGILNNFRQFYELLSREHVLAYTYQATFDEAEGMQVRTTDFLRSIKMPGEAYQLQRPELLRTLDPVMEAFFQQLVGDRDKELLRSCFVESAASRSADEQLAHISDELLRRIETLDTGSADQLQERIRDLSDDLSLSRKGFVVIVGTKGAGKSTFIERFFESVLRPSLKRRCAIARINLAKHSGDAKSVPQWLNQELQKELENALYRDGPPTFDELKGLYYDEYRRLSVGALRPAFERDRSAFDEQFGSRIESMRIADPHGFVIRLVQRAASGMSRLPVLVLDNADHHSIEFQSAVYQYARSIYENTVALIILPITDRTSWEISRQNALQSFEHETLFLPTPSLNAILRKRIEFIRSKAEPQTRDRGGKYFIGKGIRLELASIAAFADALQNVLVSTPRTSRMIGALANYDVRRALELCRTIVGSPHLGAWELVKAKITGSMEDVPQWRVERSIICRFTGTYNAEDHKFVRNVFALWPDAVGSPLLTLSLLQCLRDAPKDQHGERFVRIDTVLDYLRATGASESACVQALEELVKTGLCMTKDPTAGNLADARALRLAPAGLQHLRWCESFEYLGQMSVVTPVLSTATYDFISEHSSGATFNRGRLLLCAAEFARYCIITDREFLIVPEHVSYAGQTALRQRIRAAGERAERYASQRP